VYEAGCELSVDGRVAASEVREEEKDWRRFPSEKSLRGRWGGSICAAPFVVAFFCC